MSAESGLWQDHMYEETASSWGGLVYLNEFHSARHQIFREAKQPWWRVSKRDILLTVAAVGIASSLAVGIPFLLVDQPSSVAAIERLVP